MKIYVCFITFKDSFTAMIFFCVLLMNYYSVFEIQKKCTTILILKYDLSTKFINFKQSKGSVQLLNC